MTRIRKKISYIRQSSGIDIWMMVVVILFTLFGIIMIYEASNVVAFQDFNDKYYFVKEQLLWGAIGILLLFFTSTISYKKYFSLSVPLLLLSIISLIGVFIPGIGIKALGAHRWVGYKQFNFQPSELAKISMVIYLASWLSSKEKGRLISFLVLLGIIVGLVTLQPDLGTAVIITSIFIITYFLSGASIWQFVFLLPLVILTVIALAIISPYRYARLTTFFNPNQDPLGASYHIRQILISLGSGGIWGLGLGASRQKYQFLPEATTDSIFAIIGEEFGFIGSSLIVILYLFFIYRLFLVVCHAPDKYSFLLSGGILALFGSQILINLGSMVALFPLTGIPLPFLSYGGSNLIISLSSVGIMLNISRFMVKKK